ncbi:hypothetical protein ACFROC_08900 [Nocardia tengchongensis]|uniref:hypothetical protein n=1 Tax=Nocardia tengchongensis TaxID=2055889 RepID=UPI0036CA102B
MTDEHSHVEPHPHAHSHGSLTHTHVHSTHEHEHTEHEHSHTHEDGTVHSHSADTQAECMRARDVVVGRTYVVLIPQGRHCALRIEGSYCVTRILEVVGLAGEFDICE